MADGLSGIASGVDTAAIVEKLMSIERQGQTRMGWRKNALQVSDTALKDVQNRLTNVKSAAAALRAGSLWSDVQTVESSDATKVGVTRTSGAGPGGYTIEVTKLASATNRTFDYVAQGSASTITIGGVSVDIAANATLADAAASINSKSGSPVYATPVGSQLVLSARTTGAASDFTASGASFTEDAAKARVGANAEYKIDGGAVRTSATNVVEDAIPGLKLSFKTLGTSTVTVGAPGLDTAAVKEKLKTFVESYNGLVNNLRARLAEKGVANPSNQADAAKGLFYGDSHLSGILGKLRMAMTDPVAGNAGTLDQLSELGISTGKGANGGSSVDALAGKLTIDDEKLTAALSGDPAGVKRLLGAVSGVDGFAQRIETLIEAEVGTDGSIAGRIKANGREITRTTNRISDQERRLETTEKRLKAQFTAMEKALAQSQATQSWLSGQLAGLR